MQAILRVAFTLMLLFSIMTCVVPAKSPLSPLKRFVSFSIILDKNEGFETFRPWLEDIDFHNFTFVVGGDNNTRSYWILNSTRLDFIKSFGVLIPMGVQGYLQTWSQAERRYIVDDAFDYWVAHVGYPPNGFFSFQPDAYTNNYLKSKGFSYVQGYCFDQYVVDYMTMRGAWQMPFYADRSNGLKPSPTNDTVVILPHVTWDWVASLNVNHNLCTHMGAVLDFFHMNESLAGDYLFKFIDATLRGSSPFGYVSLQIEFNWAGPIAQNFAKTVFKELLSKGYDYYSFEDIVEWFRNLYEGTPDYSIEFESPYSNESIEWFYTSEFRVARVTSRVLSYVIYSSQKPDKFLSATAVVNFSAPPSPLNSVENSLEFTIDALGGGLYRAPIVGNAAVYYGDLAEFPLYYSGRQSSHLLRPLPF